MNELREIARVNEYAGFMRVLRDRADALKMTRANLDDVAGTQQGYCSKILAPVPMRTIGPVSFGALLQALGLTLIVAKDPEAMHRFAAQREQRVRPVHTVGKHQVVKIQITRRKLRQLARLGGQKRATKLSARQRHRIAKKAALARWTRRRQASAGE